MIEEHVAKGNIQGKIYMLSYFSSEKLPFKITCKLVGNSIF